MDEGEIRRLLTISLFGLILVASFLGGSGILGILMFAVAVLIVCFSLGQGVTWFAMTIFSSYFSGIFWPERTDTSYENTRYQDDMDRARRLVRKAKLYDAIVAYRDIIRNAPGQLEPRFNLAQIYEKVGHPGVAMGEYHKILNLNKERGANHPLALESERAISELRKSLSVKRA